jgi:hypothetical protein
MQYCAPPFLSAASNVSLALDRQRLAHTRPAVD